MINNSLKAFPDLRGLLKKYNMTYDDFAKLIGVSLNCATLKLNNKVGFSLSECVKTRNYFRLRGEIDITADKLFFDWMSTIVDKRTAI